MHMISSVKTLMASNAGRATSFSIVVLFGVFGAFLLYFHFARSSEASGSDTTLAYTGMDVTTATALPKAGTQPVIISTARAQGMDLKTEPAKRSSWPGRLRVTGRLALNESRVAHVSSLVDGVVREAPVELGQTVRQDEVLAYIDSREVGEAKLQLVKDQLQLSSAKRTSQWCGKIHQNTFALLEAIGRGQTLADIEETFKNRPVGAYRRQLVSAWANLTRAKADFERIRGLSEKAIIPEKEVIRSRAEHEAAEGTYRALMEQIKFDAQQQDLDAQQKLQAAEAAVAISRSHLLILGYKEDGIDSMDPIQEAGRVAYYPLRSPIAGTIITKDAPLSKHVDDETELFRVADLSTIWLQADVFEKDLNTSLNLQDKTVTFEASSYPGRQFTADIFSLGDMVNNETRAIQVLALAENPERLLKPGMFVDVELTPRNDLDVLQLSMSAVQRHAGTTFVFVSDETKGFERRDVTLGRSTEEVVEITTGLADGELVVINGGFALKSEMLSELMAE